MVKIIEELNSSKNEISIKDIINRAATIAKILNQMKKLEPGSSEWIKLSTKLVQLGYGIDSDGEIVEDNFDNYEDEIREIGQEFTSGNTSINSSRLPDI